MKQQGYGTDSHCHLDYLARKGMVLKDVLARARGAGIEKFVTIATSMSGLDSLSQIAENNEGVYMSVGQHPCFVAEEGVVEVEALYKASSRSCVVAIGETGLDYYRARESEQMQRESFQHHITVARETNLPLVIHSRAANDDMLNVVETAKKEGDFKAIWHCFEGDKKQASRAVALDMYISFSGLLTYPDKGVIREIAKDLAWDRILVETDSPYLSPVPLKKTLNEPAHIVHTENVLAGERGVGVDTLRMYVSKTFEQVFGLANF